ncbi:MAG: tRNA epoxyqueuosine(34) reductase QueG [Brevinematales bacterium]|nr:tRNA epoxyqueuosine(34) reductase QueG [Brevinematales bacterium]
MKNLIKEIALDVGFDIISFSSKIPPIIKNDVTCNYSNWIANSFNGDMEYLKRYGEKRFDPELIEDWVRSIILVGASYFNSTKFDSPSEEYGRVSMYAWGKDYHFVIKSMLQELVDRLKKEIGEDFKYRIFSDSTPIYEKGFAIASGLGFQGKNTCVINLRLGSFFFIGEVLTNLEIEPDSEIKFKGCGSCTKCITSCPTNALGAYILDSRKCISYLTIEYKNIIPEDLALKMRDWIFGCDICQEVCPFNKQLYIKKFLTRISHFKDSVMSFLNLKEIMKIPSNNQFRKFFKGRPFIRAGRRGLIRNAIIVAVNNNARRLCEEIAKLRQDDDEIISKTARWAIDRMSG